MFDRCFTLFLLTLVLLGGGLLMDNASHGAAPPKCDSKCRQRHKHDFCGNSSQGSGIVWLWTDCTFCYSTTGINGCTQIAEANTGNPCLSDSTFLNTYWYADQAGAICDCAGYYTVEGSAPATGGGSTTFRGRCN